MSMATLTRAFVCSALLATASFGLAHASPAGPPTTITVGALTLTLCNTDYTGYCGAIDRPIDPTGKVAGTLSVGFEYYPRRDLAHDSQGTILPQEGGPGYSSTGSRDFYLGLFDPLRSHREVLIVDKRGTGLSDPIDCPQEQTGSIALSAVAACANQLGDTAWFYGTDFAAQDIVAVMDALSIDKADFYGDSYGTFVGQILAALFPQRLRSIVLDSAFPVRPPDIWFGTDWAQAWSGIDISCARSPSCAVLGGSASGRMQRLIADLRRQPISGTAPNGNGHEVATTADISSLIVLIDSAGYGESIYRDLDASARAWLDSGDSAPLLRIIAESQTGGVDEPVDLSDGLYTAVTCSDYPNLYDLRASRSIRDRQYATALEAARQDRPGLFAPFTVDEGIDSNVYITPLNSCLPWIAPPAGIVPGVPLPPSLKYPAVPTLVLSGDLDSITSPIDADETAADFPNAVHLIIPNLPHVVAGGDEIGCTSSIVLHFVANLSPGDTSCIPLVRPARTVPRFARQAQQLAPLEPLANDQTTPAQRRIAAAGLETVGDVIARWYASYLPHLKGLRGGEFSYTETEVGYNFKLTNVLWTEDVAVSGTVSWNMNTAIIRANVDLSTDSVAVGNLAIQWNDADTNAMATVRGQIQGAVLKARRIAP